MRVVVFGVLLAAAVADLFYSFVMFDRLVRLEHDSVREAWEADGRPRGFFWRSPDCTLLGSDLARVRLSMGWLFITPAWTRGVPQAASPLTRLRVSVLIWNVAIIAMAAAAALGTNR